MGGVIRTAGRRDALPPHAWGAPLPEGAGYPRAHMPPWGTMQGSGPTAPTAPDGAAAGTRLWGNIPAAAVGAAAPAVGAAAPGVGAAAPGVGAAVPAMGAAAPGVGAAAPGVGAAVPAVGAAAPAVGAAAAAPAATAPAWPIGRIPQPLQLASPRPRPPQRVQCCVTPPPRWLAYAGAGVAFCGVFAPLVYVIDRAVKHWVATAHVSDDASHWAQLARDKYTACYNGCDDCNDPDWAYNACQLTAALVVQGVHCSGNDIWSWDTLNRFPPACLAALGSVLQGQSLAAERRHQMGKEGLIVLAFVAACVGAAVVFGATRCAGAYVERRAARAQKVEDGA